MTEIKLIRNDKLFDLEFTITDANGNAVNLTDSTVKFKMSAQGADTLKIDAACTITGALAGECKYTVQDGDLDAVEAYDAELEITYTSGKVITAIAPTIKVVSDLPKS